MAFSLQNFKSQFDELARAYMFKVKFTGAPISTLLQANSDKFTLLVESTTLPQKTVEPIDVQFMGQQHKLAGNVTYPDWECTFRVDSNYDIYKALREWNDKIRYGEGDVANVLRNHSTYKGTVELIQIDENQADKQTVTLYGVWPSALGSLTLDTKTSDVQLFPVTFVYDYHKYSGTPR